MAFKSVSPSEFKFADGFATEFSSRWISRGLAASASSRIPTFDVSSPSLVISVSDSVAATEVSLGGDSLIGETASAEFALETFLRRAFSSAFQEGNFLSRSLLSLSKKR